MADRILAVEMDDDGHLFAVWTEGERGGPGLYDFAWSKRLATHIFRMSGWGGRVYLEHGRHNWWAVDGVEVAMGRGGPAPSGSRLAEMPAVAQGDIFLDGFEDIALWCSACDDWQPASEPCEHCWWDEEAEDYSTPDERQQEDSPDGS